MKRRIAAIVLAAAAWTAPALAIDLGLSITVGEPGFFGQIDLGNIGRPRLVYEQPVLIERRYRDVTPIYLRVPPGHAKNWRRYCDRYNACSRPVYFVRDDWYRDVYAPRYRSEREDRREDRRDERRDDRRDEQHGNGHGKDHKGHGDR